MARFSTKTEFGNRKVFVDVGNKYPDLVATYSAGIYGEMAFQAFRDGVALVGRNTLLDEDAGAYLVGDVGQLAG